MRGREQPDREVGARPAVVERVRPELGERGGPRVEPVEVLAPRGDGIGLVEADAERDELPEPLDVGLAEHLPRPALVRRADAAPVERAFSMQPPLDLGRLERDRATDALAVEVGEKLRLGVPRRRRCSALPAAASASVFCHSGEYVSASSGPNSIIARRTCWSSVDDVDVRRTGPVRLPRQRAHEVGVLDESVDEDLLPVLHVRADADRELGVALEPVAVRAHASCHSSFRISGTSVPSASTASTSSSGPPTMKSTCDVRDVEAVVRLAVDDEREAGAVRDVAGRVLVEERVVEERARLADARLARHERDLAEPVGVLDRLEVAADELRTALRLDAHGSTVLERQLQTADDLAGERKRPRRADRPLRASRVGRGEDLLGRHVRDVSGSPMPSLPLRPSSARSAAARR